MQSKGRWGTVLSSVVTACAILVPGLALALEATLTAPGASEDLTNRLRGASSAMSAEARGLDSPQELLAASLSDYHTLVQILYDEGYFSPVVHIRLDGREAAYIGPLNTPNSIGQIKIDVTIGAPFRFGRAGIGPLAPDTTLPEAYANGLPATTGAIRDAAIAGIDGWRNVGHAKADVGGQNIVANHREAVLDADIEMLPGPKLAFGTMHISGESKVRRDAIAKISGFPTGETYHPEQVQKVGTRLRRTGAFSSVSIKEAEQPNPDGTLDFVTTVEDMPLRRISFGVELSSNDGLDVSAKWTHRNLWGAAERLQFEATMRNLGGQEDVDGRLSLRLDRPATLGPDDNMFYLAEIERRNHTHYSATSGSIGIGARRVFSDTLFGEVALTGGLTIADDAFGTGREFYLFTLPIKVEWDKRNDKVNATTGFFLDTRFTPFAGFSDSESGGQVYVDGRGYYSLTRSSSVVLAGRVQVGSVLGASQRGTSPEFLFFSGGSGTVRGQPYESLGTPVGGQIAGGRSILAMSAEVRGRITEKISLVGFFDFGAVDASSMVDTNSSYHSGAGLGIRYDLGGFGPLRFDLALPVDGATGEGLQFYIGIGQAF
jgi:translocation and assembly module TamA